MYLCGVPTKPLRWIQISFAIVWMSIHLPSPRSNHLSAHLGNILMLSMGEVLKLKWAGVIKEVFYPEWLANTMVVKKKTGKWRVCVNFTDLNNSCPNDPFLLPWINQLVDATVGHPWMSFLDTFQGDHQIPLALDDQEKTAFLTPTGN